MDTAFVLTAAALATLILSPATGWAQNAPAKPPAPAASAATGAPQLLIPGNAPKETATEAAERAKRQAEGPMYWIKVNAQRVGNPDDKPATRPTAVVVKPAGAPGASPPPNAGADVGMSAAKVPAGVVRAAELAAAHAAAAASAAAVADRSRTEPPRAEPVQLASLNPPPSALSGKPVAPPAPAAPEPEPLVILSGNEPKFPDQLMRRLRRGAVQMRVDVATDGSVIQVTVLNSSHPRLEQAAQEAAQSMRFKPINAPAAAEVNFTFDLDS